MKTNKGVRKWQTESGIDFSVMVACSWQTVLVRETSRSAIMSVHTVTGFILREKSLISTVESSMRAFRMCVKM